MKFFCGILFLSISISVYASINKGISLIENGKYDQAYSFFDNYIKTNNKDSSAFYYLGKISVYNKEYKKAIEYYETSYELNHDKSIILKELSIAYSLDNQPKITFLCLLELHAKNLKPDVDFNSEELSAFKNSVYYKDYTKTVKELTPGKIPTNPNELKKSILSNGFASYPGSPSPAGSFAFKINGTFNRIDGGGYTGEDVVGTWIIKNNKLILKELGTIKYLGFETEANNEIIKNGLGFFDKHKKWVWIKKNTVYEEIPFGSIRIDVIALSAQHNMGYTLYKCNDFGNAKIINGIVGKVLNSMRINY